MFYGNTMNGVLTVKLPEQKLDALVKDIYSLKSRCRMLGKLGGKPNYVMNIFDETAYDEAVELIGGHITIYYETDNRDDDLAKDLELILSSYEVQIISFTRKLKV